jgi:hypothetical protein
MAGVSQPTPNVFRRLARLSEAYLIIGEIVGKMDVKGERIIKALKGMERMVVKKTSLKDVTAIYAYALGSAVSSLLLSVTEKFEELRTATESNVVRLRDVMAVEGKKILETMYPEDLREILRIRLKLPKNRDADDYYKALFEGMVVEILSRVQYLMKSSEIAVENARSGMLDTQSKFLHAAIHIVRDGGSDT